MSSQDVRSRFTGSNIPTYERVVSAALGTAAVLLGARLRERTALGWLLAATGAPLLARAATGHSVLYRQLGARKGVEAKKTITIDRPRAEIYRFWRSLDNVPRVLGHVTDVVIEDDHTSHWMVQEGPVLLEWLAQVVEDVPDRRIRWQSLPGGDVDCEGTVELRDARGKSGTEVRISLRYEPPGGILVSAPLGALLRRISSQQLGAELTQLRAFLEAGRTTRRRDEPKAAPLPAPQAPVAPPDARGSR